MNVHLIIVLKMFIGSVYPSVHGERADLSCSVLFALMGLFNMYMYIYFHDLFDLSNKQGGSVF